MKNVLWEIFSWSVIISTVASWLLMIIFLILGLKIALYFMFMWRKKMEDKRLILRVYLFLTGICSGVIFVWVQKPLLWIFFGILACTTLWWAILMDVKW